MKKIDKVIFITGASSGIGEALAREYLARGARVALCARRKDRLEVIAGEFPDESLALECDVSSETSIRAALQKCVDVFGRIDVVVANAGVGIAGRFEKSSIEDYRKQFETNVFGVLQTLKEALDEIKKSRGALVLIGSANSYVSEPKKTAYCMTKFAVRALAEGLYWELQPYGVNVTLVCPGLVESEIRKISKEGVYQENAVDPAPSFLIMPRKKAAREILMAIEAKKKEVVITYHAKLAVWLQRHTPWVLSLWFKGGRAFSR